MPDIVLHLSQAEDISEEQIKQFLGSDVKVHVHKPIPIQPVLTSRQLEIMRQNYGNFRRIEQDASRAKADTRRYREQPGYETHPDGDAA